MGVGTRMRWSGGESGCRSWGKKKLANFFHDYKSCFCLLRKNLSCRGGRDLWELGNRIRWECVETGWSCGLSGGVVWD